MQPLKRMRIGIDISQIAYTGTGVSRYLQGLVGTIMDSEKRHSWVFFFSSLRNSLDVAIEHKIKKSGQTLLKYPFPPTLLSFFWNDLHILPVERLTGDLDWFITSDWTEPPGNMKKATVIHDLVFLKYPETVDKKILKTQEKRLSWVKKESDLIFCVSKTTKQDVIDLLHMDERKVRAVYSGVDVVKPTESQILSTLKKFHLRTPFILTVGKIEPRKNIRRLIEAFNKLTNTGVDLVIVGPAGWERLEDVPNGRIKMLGFINDDDLFSLYSSCLFFVYPSLYEGFGYPVLEAMRLGAPVATSNTSSLKEFGEEAAYLFNPLDTNDIRKALVTLLADEVLQKNLAKKGFEKSISFTWKNCYSQMIKSLEE